jgi:cytochrome c2
MIVHRMTMALAGLVLGALAAHPARAQDPTSGARLFRSQCSLCHSVQPGRNIVGPTLFGVVGRHSGQVPGFPYTAANRSSGLVWDPTTLDRYLAAPGQVVPGTAMTYPGLRDGRQRADVIAFLATQR